MEDNEITFLIDEIEVFDVLSNTEKILLRNNLQKKHLKQKEIIYTQRNGDHFVYYLINGKVKRGKHFQADGEMITGIVSPKSFFCLKSILRDKKPDSEYAEALTDIVYLQINSEIVTEIMSNNALFSSKLFHHLLIYTRRIESRIEMMHYSKNIQERVVGLLIEFAEEYGSNVGDEILIKLNLTHQDMADFVFSTRQSITSIFNQLRNENLIYYDRSLILIRNLEYLRNWTQVKAKSYE